MCIVKKNKKFLALPTPNVINRGGENYTHMYLVFYIKISRERYTRVKYIIRIYSFIFSYSCKFVYIYIIIRVRKKIKFKYTYVHYLIWRPSWENVDLDLEDLYIYIVLSRE